MGTTSQASIIVDEVLTRDITRFTLKLTIENVKRFQNHTRLLYSKGVTLGELGREDNQCCRWYLAINPCCRKGALNDEMNYLCMYLIADGMSHNYDPDTDELDILETEYTIRVTTGKGSDVPVLKLFPIARHAFSVADNEQAAGDLSHAVLFGSDKEAGLVIDDCITIFADILIYQEPRFARVCEPNVLSSVQSLTRFIQRQVEWMKPAHDQSQWGDFILISSDGKEFPVSRFLLMAHSPVFAAMLTHNSKEKQESRCVMENIDGESTQILSEYLHSCGTDTRQITICNAEKILMMADQYALMDLRPLCEGILAKTVTAENAVHFLVMACQRELSLLKEAALKVIQKNMGTVLKGKAMEKAMHEPEVVQVIMEHCSKTMKVIDDSSEMQG